MNGPHDVGGKHGLGSIDPRPEEPVFHHEWERRMFGIAYCILASGAHKLDATRYAIEQMPHAHYLGSSYYEHWLFGYQRTMNERGLCTAAEVDQRIEEQAALEGERQTTASSGASQSDAGAGRPSEMKRRVLEVLEGGRPHGLPCDTMPRYDLGQRVRARNLHPHGHLRMPGYAKGRQGVIDAYHGCFEHPAAGAHDEPDPGAHLYRVAFRAQELWGQDAELPSDIVCLDLIEDYLEAVA
jgi:nitrile hydratase subunit beta